MGEDKKIIYMDYAATTPLNRQVYLEMEPFHFKFYGNASSIYSLSSESKIAIDGARERVSSAINSNKNEIYFTSCGTESDNWALKGVAYANRHKGNHIITTEIEHHAILNTCKYLENQGFNVTYLPVDKYGIVNLEQLKSSITNNTILVSVMFANNEIGSIQPIKEIGEICRSKQIIFHTDAVQAIGHVPVDVQAMNIDLLSMSAHKFYGPKGVGALYIRKGVAIDNYLHGGAQERARRAGTENTAGIVGIGKAIELTNCNINEETKRLLKLRSKFIQGLLSIEGTKLNGPDDNSQNRLPGNINVCFLGLDAEILLMLLDLKGICVSVGSACSAGAIKPSHVLMAMGLEEAEAKASLRFSIGANTTEEDVSFTIESIKEIVNKVSSMS